MRLVSIVLAVLSAGSVAADIRPPLHKSIEQAAHALFPDMPSIRPVDQIAGLCGADHGVNPIAAYCTSENVILMTQEGTDRAPLAHHLAHMYGHAVQVRHGIADIALREIRRRPDEEAMLRGWVSRQVECIAGAILREADIFLDISTIYAREPLTGSHWGRNPLAKGPQVAVGLKARAQWLATGYQHGVSACAPGEFGSELLVEALR